MKLETIESRVPEQWRFFLARSSSMDSFSESSTMLVDDLVKDNKSRRHRQVRICEDQNIYHTAQEHDDLFDERTLWYSSLDLDVFRAETRIAARSTLSAAKKGGDDWPLRLEQTYLDLCDERYIEGSYTMPKATPSMVGLERRMLVRTVGKDRDCRRAGLLKHFRFILATISDPEQQEYLMALASKASSKPCCLYGAFCAKWWWEQGEN
eukprot:scaffold945_cov170-Amphora_coffeaeformis.AAC.29